MNSSIVRFKRKANNSKRQKIFFLKYLLKK